MSHTYLVTGGLGRLCQFPKTVQLTTEKPIDIDAYQYREHIPTRQFLSKAKNKIRTLITEELGESDSRLSKMIFLEKVEEITIGGNHVRII